MEFPLTKYIPDEIIDAFGGENNILALPRYCIDNSKLGSLRDYIDFIRYDTVSDPIMIGVDKWCRTFIVFKFQFVQPNKTINFTTVLFQRYTDHSYWTSASNPSGIYHIFGDGGLKSDHYDLLRKVLADKRLNYAYNQYTGEIGDYVLSIALNYSLNNQPNDAEDMDGQESIPGDESLHIQIQL
ncbi:hypothetical protein QKU48_gp1333 [Fadolivirus algeromassiliense]|jgi:hypothetical protein|uniref:Uncharacterized protein n=1 Tax=Fadolivirus FV1/VV64 TaxID=3070911 RepID=A0A7D3UVG1_9VIRU|nr:hypothetical protein QKU48_gp1333 [Fadolivirus algeromassiliense]QKF94791.1 hypothetical protein Fadolivirus_1_1333 [Fadolivirus FV1/VV64]